MLFVKYTLCPSANHWTLTPILTRHTSNLEGDVSQNFTGNSVNTWSFLSNCSETEKKRFSGVCEKTVCPPLSLSALAYRPSLAFLLFGNSPSINLSICLSILFYAYSNACQIEIRIFHSQVFAAKKNII